MRLLLIGCGNLGSIILESWVKKQLFREICVIQPSLKSAINFQTQSNVWFVKDIKEVPNSFQADIIVLAIKPQLYKNVIPQIPFNIYKDNTIIISVIAGINLEILNNIIGIKRKIVRIMPNIAIKVGQSINLICGNNSILPDDKIFIDKLCVSLGLTIWLDHEDELDYLTPISGSGPAYIYLLAEIFIQIIKEYGIDRETAEILVKQTFKGAMSIINDESKFGDLINKVASKGGVTEVALEILKPYFLEGMTKAIGKAQKRVKELVDENSH